MVLKYPIRSIETIEKIAMDLAIELSGNGNWKRDQVVSSSLILGILKFLFD